VKKWMRVMVVCGLGLMLFPVNAVALDKVVSGTVTFQLLLADTTPEQNGITKDGADTAMDTTDLGVKFDIFVRCATNTTKTLTSGNTTVTFDPADTGVVHVATTDVVVSNPEEECIHWSAGVAGSEFVFDGESLIAYTPEKFKASIEPGHTYCDVSASTSGSSFTVATCKESNLAAITLVDDHFNGLLMKAYTNGTAQCNVAGQGVLVEDMTSAGVVTAMVSPPSTSGFSAAPNTTNCGMYIGN